jgi:hypothetical protein
MILIFFGLRVNGISNGPLTMRSVLIFSPDDVVSKLSVDYMWCAERLLDVIGGWLKFKCFWGYGLAI